MKKIILISSIFLFWNISYPKTIFAEEIKVNSVNVTPNETYFLIDYNMDGEVGNEYDINLFLKRESNPSFSYKIQYPKASGDIGKLNYTKKNNSIKWFPGEEFIDQFSDYSDLYFEIHVYEKSSGISWWNYVGGAALIGGSAAILLLKKPPQKLGGPPSRP